MNFLFKFPSRGRPESFKKVLDAHLQYLSGLHEYKFIFSFDNDDELMKSHEIKNYINEKKINYKICYGNNQNKIQAYNANLEGEDFDVLILLQDDMFPLIKEYDILISQIFENSPFGLDCVIHFHTNMWDQLLNIWNIIGKKYYERFNYIYFPGYKSIGADNEFTEVSRMLNRSIWINKTPFEHLKIIGDSTESKNHEFNAHDDNLFWERRSKNYYLEKKEIIYYFDSWSSIKPLNDDNILKMYS